MWSWNSYTLLVEIENKTATKGKHFDDLLYR